MGLDFRRIVKGIAKEKSHKQWKRTRMANNKKYKRHVPKMYVSALIMVIMMTMLDTLKIQLLTTSKLIIVRRF